LVSTFIYILFFINSDAGAGGEKVLWQAIKALQNHNMFNNKQYNIHILVYSASSLTLKEILKQKVKERFGIDISEKNLHLINLDKKLANTLDPQNYPTFTLLWQAIASIRVTFNACYIMPCDVFADTMGVAFCYPFIRLFFPCKIYSYTHYPMVSQDMLNTV
jgi:alpha-1,2-mannosyltransferase